MLITSKSVSSDHLASSLRSCTTLSRAAVPPPMLHYYYYCPISCPRGLSSPASLHPGLVSCRGQGLGDCSRQRHVATVPPLLSPSSACHPPPLHVPHTHLQASKQASTAARSNRTLGCGRCRTTTNFLITHTSPMSGASTQLTLRSRTPRARPRLCSSVSSWQSGTFTLVMASTCPPRQ